MSDVTETAMLSEQTRARILDTLKLYPTKRAAIMRALWAAQEEAGWLSPEVMADVAGLLDLHPAEVAAVASFYTMYHKAPTGKYLVEFCVGLPCALRGAHELFHHACHRLNLPEDGGTTADGLFTVGEVECVGYCEIAPVLQLHWETYGPLDTARLDEILSLLARGEVPPPDGAKTPTVPVFPIDVGAGKGGTEEQKGS
jgi:NADH-quinone oxidoreductase E subunit